MPEVTRRITYMLHGAVLGNAVLCTYVCRLKAHFCLDAVLEPISIGRCVGGGTHEVELGGVGAR